MLRDTIVILPGPSIILPGASLMLLEASLCSGSHSRGSGMTNFWTVMTIRGSKRHSNGCFLTKTVSEEAIRGSDVPIQGFREHKQGSKSISEGPKG